MVLTKGIDQDLILTKAAGEKKKQVLFISLYNPGTVQQEGSIFVNNTQIFGRNIPSGENVVFSTERLLLETDGDQLKVSGQVNKVVSYADFA